MVFCQEFPVSFRVERKKNDLLLKDYLCLFDEYLNLNFCLKSFNLKIEKERGSNCLERRVFHIFPLEWMSVDCSSVTHGDG